jgi:NADH-quinone oxidoreductase subunit M
MLWLYQRVFYGNASEEVQHHMPEITGREWACMVPLIIMMVWMGTYTQTFLTPVTKATARLLEQSNSPAVRVQVPVKSPPIAALATVSDGGSQNAH